MIRWKTLACLFVFCVCLEFLTRYMHDSQTWVFIMTCRWNTVDSHRKHRPSFYKIATDVSHRCIVHFYSQLHPILWWYHSRPEKKTLFLFLYWPNKHKILHYDNPRYLFSISQDGNGYIDEQELDALLKDLSDKNKMVISTLKCNLDQRVNFSDRETAFWQDVDVTGLSGYKKSIMALSDGGKLFRTELEIVLCRDSELWDPPCCLLPTSFCNLVHVWPAYTARKKTKTAPKSTRSTAVP